MFKNHIDIKQKHHAFIKRVCETSIVYALKNNDGFATSSSNEFEDENGKPIGIICFWSDVAFAKLCIKNEWSDYKPIEINLAEFIENWCIGIENDGLLIGTNFDKEMFGYEIGGYELVLEFIEELKANNKKIEFFKFESINDLEIQVKEAMQ